MDRVAALVLAGGRGEQFGALSQHRTKAAFPVAGYYRIIDFALSNLTHSDIRNVGIVIQYLPASLVEHIGSGRPWDFDMADRRLQFMTPFVGINETRWFNGTGDAIAKNLNLLLNENVDEVLVLSGEHLYRMDYRALIRQHREREADVTIACVDVPVDQHHPRFGSVEADAEGRVLRFEEKPASPIASRVSMGIYCFRRTWLEGQLLTQQDATGEGHFSLARDVVSKNIGNANAWVFDFNDTWHYLADLDDYFNCHMKLACGQADPICEPWDILTNFSDRHLGSRPPAYFSPESEVRRTITSPGCRIYGSVNSSVLSPGVTVGEQAEVNEAIIFHDVSINEGARVYRTIIDKDAVIGPGAVVGSKDGPLTVIPKGHYIRPGEVVAAGAQLRGRDLGVGTM